MNITQNSPIKKSRKRRSRIPDFDETKDKELHNLINEMKKCGSNFSLIEYYSVCNIHSSIDTLVKYASKQQ